MVNVTVKIIPSTLRCPGRDILRLCWGTSMKRTDAILHALLSMLHPVYVGCRRKRRLSKTAFETYRGA